MMHRRPVARKTVKTALIAKAIRRLSRRAEKHPGKH
jgi:hypothetical protein